MKRFVLIGLAILVIASLTAPVFAWEFSMKGETEYRYRYWTRTGNNDIFGSMGGTVDLGINQLQTFPTTAQTTRGGGQAFGATATFGVLAGQNRFGSDMQLNDYRMTLYPTIKVNPAIEVTASVNLTSLGVWSDGQPLISGAANATAAGPARAVGFVNSLYRSGSGRGNRDKCALNLCNVAMAQDSDQDSHAGFQHRLQGHKARHGPLEA